MYHFLLGCSILKTLRPFFRKNVLENVDSHDFLFLNTFFISSLVFLIFLYKLIFDKEIYKTIECAKKLNVLQIVCFFFLAALTVGASTLYLEYEKQSKNSVMINSMYIKIISALVLLGTSIFVFKENCSWKQIVGVLVVILGLTLMSSK